MNAEFTIVETIEQARAFIGGGSPLHFSKKNQEKLKQETISAKHLLHTAKMECNNPKARLHFNGSIAAREAIVSKLNQLLKQ